MPLPFIEFRTTVEHVKLVNPTEQVLVFNISTYTTNAFRITPNSGRIDPNKEFDFVVELISAESQIYDMFHETSQFCFECIELPVRTPMVEWVDKHPESVRNGTAIGDICIHFPTTANEDVKWSVVQKAVITARFSAAMVWNERPPRPTTSISETAAYLRTNVGCDVLTYCHPLRPGTSVPLQLANISPHHIILYKWLIASTTSSRFVGRDQCCVCPHSGRIDPDMDTSINFITGSGKHPEKIMLQWVEIERGTEIGDWVDEQLGVDRARWVEATSQRWGDRVMVHEWRIRTKIDEPIVEKEEVEIKQEQISSKSAGRLLFRCVVGQSIGLYQRSLKNK